MKATVALFIIGLCAAAPLQQRQANTEDPNATFTTTPSTLKLRSRYVTQPPPYPTNGGSGDGLYPVPTGDPVPPGADSSRTSAA
ncbi:hypothetical protein NUW58_g8427 [Xylaria curta]|uniref:Uncharacterized protein n=1 Tax=Xylaria curta TaxID=42375 RepID=A0ACC1N8I4_9PEZI|nr:hypothetical protein NUW58_g8427 [Xylaria curta]